MKVIVKLNVQEAIARGHLVSSSDCKIDFGAKELLRLEELGLLKLFSKHLSQVDAGVFELRGIVNSFNHREVLTLTEPTFDSLVEGLQKLKSDIDKAQAEALALDADFRKQVIDKLVCFLDGKYELPRQKRYVRRLDNGELVLESCVTRIGPVEVPEIPSFYELTDARPSQRSKATELKHELEKDGWYQALVSMVTLDQHVIARRAVTEYEARQAEEEAKKAAWIAEHGSKMLQEMRSSGHEMTSKIYALEHEAFQAAQLKRLLQSPPFKGYGRVNTTKVGLCGLSATDYTQEIWDFYKAELEKHPLAKLQWLEFEDSRNWDNDYLAPFIAVVVELPDDVVVARPIDSTNHDLYWWQASL